MKKTIFIAALLFSSYVFAEEDPSIWKKVKEGAGKAYDATVEGTKKAVEYSKEKAHDVQGAMDQTRTNRETKPWDFIGSYSPLETWVPGKLGFTLGYNVDASNTYEFELMRGSYGIKLSDLDIGDITQTRFSLLWRSFNQRSTFNFRSGLYYDILEGHLGDKLLDSIAGTHTSFDLFDIRTAGITWGLGNRWQTKGGFNFGADWFLINIPLKVIEEDIPYLNSNANPNDKDDVRDAADVLERWPTFAVVRIQLGVSF